MKYGCEKCNGMGGFPEKTTSGRGSIFEPCEEPDCKGPPPRKRPYFHERKKGGAFKHAQETTT